MGKLVELQAALERVLRVGEELRNALQQPVTDANVERVNQLVELRGSLLREVSVPPESEPGGPLIDILQSLLRQQRVLEEELERYTANLREAARAAGHAKASARGMRQVMGGGPRTRLLDELR